MNTNAPQQCE